MAVGMGRLIMVNTSLNNNWLSLFDIYTFKALANHLLGKSRLSTWRSSTGQPRDSHARCATVTTNIGLGWPRTGPWGPHFLHHGPVLGQPKRKIASQNMVRTAKNSPQINTSRPIPICLICILAGQVCCGPTIRQNRFVIPGKLE